MTRSIKTEKKTLILLLLAIAAGLIFVLHSYLFGENILAFHDIGSDTADQYLSLYALIANQLRAGDFSLWNWTDGFGISLFQLNLTNPALLIVYLLGALFGTQIIPYAMVWLYLAEVLLAGGLCYLYLSRFAFTEPAKAMASFMYAFSGFLMVWGQHYQFGILPALLVFALFVIEGALKKEKTPVASLALVSFLLVMNSLYMAYMMLLLCAFYVPARLLTEGESRARFFRRLFAIGLSLLLGVGLAMGMLLPAALAMGQGGRLGSELSVFARLFGYRYPRDYYQTLFGRLFSSTARGINQYVGHLNYYEGPNLFFSTLFVILLPQYLFLLPRMRMEKRRRICHYLLFVLFALSVSTCFVPVLMNGLTAPFSRWFFLLFPYFALISALTLTEIFTQRRVDLIALVISLALLLRFYLLYLRATNIPSYGKVMAGHLLCGILMCLLLFFIGRPLFDRFFPFFAAALCLLLATNLLLDAYSSYFERVTVRKGDEYFGILYDEDTQNALAYLRDHETQFCRTEKTYMATNGMDAPVQNYIGVSAYNSNQNRYIAEYVRKNWEELYYADANHYEYALGLIRGNQADLCGIRYVLSKVPEAEIPGMEAWKTFGSVTVFKSRQVESIATYHAAGSFVAEKDKEGKTLVRLSFDTRDQKAKIDLPMPEKGARISATVTAETEGVLFLAMPFESGWEARIDGRKGEILRANDGFIALPMGAGTHEITLSYRAPGLLPGLAISVVSLMILCALAFGGRGRKHAL